MAAASPAGPPPTMRTSYGMDSLSDSRREGSSSSPPPPPSPSSDDEKQRAAPTVSELGIEGTVRRAAVDPKAQARGDVFRRRPARSGDGDSDDDDDDDDARRLRGGRTEEEEEHNERAAVERASAAAAAANARRLARRRGGRHAAAAASIVMVSYAVKRNCGEKVCFFPGMRRSASSQWPRVDSASS
mmetsp:Transcript_42712/g.79027  ORF Transcript_42712/g.79027 Transcript_42712/m.79027 type:complete len:187 (+) Transcript_42712:1790-2350(+)